MMNKEEKTLEKYITDLQESRCDYKEKCNEYNVGCIKEILCNYQKTNNNLQQRIDKAVEYNKEIKNKIEKQLDNGQSYDFIVAGYLTIFHDTLEEILKGEDK